MEKRTLNYTLTLEVDVDGTPDNEDELLDGVAADIQDSIPGVLCDRNYFVVLVNGIELVPATPHENISQASDGDALIGKIQCAANCGAWVPVRARDEGEDHLCDVCCAGPALASGQEFGAQILTQEDIRSVRAKYHDCLDSDDFAIAIETLVLSKMGSLQNDAKKWRAHEKRKADLLSRGFLSNPMRDQSPT